jgi:hypothetical protein
MQAYTRHWGHTMSIANHFDRRCDAGFVRSYDLRSARRQFQVSLILILVMAGTAIALGLMTRLDLSSSLGHHTVLRAGVPGGAET